jgi:WD40 repeat protein
MSQDTKRILVVSANPDGADLLHLDREYKEIEKAWKSSDNKYAFQIDKIGAADFSSFTEKFEEYKPNILHFCGHASQDKGLFFENSNGGSAPVKGEHLANFLANFNFVECVFLNACETSNIASELLSKIKYVIGVEDKLSNNSAIAFSKEFYKALFSGNDYNSLVNIAHSAVELDKNLPSFKPVLLIANKKLNLIKTAIDETEEIFLSHLSEYHKNNTIRPKLDAEIALKDESHKFVTMLDINGESLTFNSAISCLNLEQGNVLLIYGQGGAGKTFMLLNQVQNEMNLLNSSQRKHFVYVPLNELNLNDDLPISRYLNKYVFQELNWASYYARGGEEILFFLDGFNEIPPQNRKHIAIEILNYSNLLNCKIVVASRFEDTLAEQLGFGIEASIMDLTQPIIESYLDNCGYKGAFPLNPRLVELLRNPLLLTLYASTTKFLSVNPKYIKARQFCQWVENDNNLCDSTILWNYLNCDVMKSTTDELRILNWICVRFFWSRIAFFMQSKKENTFACSEDEISEQIRLTISWLKANKNKHREILRASTFVRKKWLYDNLSNFIDSLSEDDIYRHLLLNQVLMGGTSNKMKFFHQSLRDCLAAVHLLNASPNEEEPFPNEWLTSSLTKNVYMLHHLSELSMAIYNNTLLDDAINTLRGREITSKNQTLNNILLVFKQPSQLFGDFSSFDFSHLDLRNSILTEYTLSNDEGKGANFTGAIIGEKTFQKAAHTKPIDSVAMSSNGRKVLTCGKDKVLLWDFPTRSVEREIYVYTERLGEYDKNAINQVAFSQTSNSILFTDGNILFEVNLDTNKKIEYIGATSVIRSLLTFVDQTGNERYYACDSKANVLCWNKGSQSVREIIENNDEGIYQVTGFDNYTIVLQNYISLSIINENIETVRKTLGNIEYTGLHSLGDTSKKLIVLKNERDFSIYNFDDNAVQSLSVDYTIYKIIPSFDGNYLIIVGIKENAKVFSVYIRDNSKKEILFTEVPFVVEGYIEKQAQILSFDVYENRFYYGLSNGKIYIGYFYKNDEATYIGTYLDNHAPYVESLAVKKDNICFVAYEDGCLREWNYITGGLLHKYDDENGHISTVCAVSIANNKDLIASGDSDGRILLWDSVYKTLIREIGNCSSFQSDALKLSGLSNSITSISFTHDDLYLIVSTFSGFISVWSISSQEGEISTEPFIKVNNHNTAVKQVLYYRIDNKNYVVSGDRYGKIIFWELAIDTGQLNVIKSVDDAHGNNRVRSFSLAPNSQNFVSYGEDEALLIWSTKTCEIIRRIVVDDEGIFGFNADSCCYSSDGKKIYLTGRKLGISVPVVELDIGSDERNVLFSMQDIVSRNGGVIKVNENSIISGNLCGNIYSYFNEKVVHRMKAYEEVSKKLKHVKGLKEAKFEKEELRKQFIIESPITGQFEIWVRSNIIPNLIGLIDWSSTPDNSLYNSWMKRILAENQNSSESIFGSDSLYVKLENTNDRVHILSSAFIVCTIGDDNVSAEAERSLLEACMVYLYYEAPPFEQNVLLLLELFDAEISEDNSSEELIETDLGRLFNMLKDKNPNHHALSLYENYINTFGRNNSVVRSLLLRFAPLFSWNGQEEFTRISNNNINKLAISLVCNQPQGSCCPAAFTDIDVNRVAFLELVFHYMNSCNDKLRNKKEISRILEMDTSTSIKIFEDIIDKNTVGNYKQLRLFLADNNNANAMKDANIELLKFFNEYD